MMNRISPAAGTRWPYPRRAVHSRPPQQTLLQEALAGPSAVWIRAALDQSKHGDAVLVAAIDAAVLASALCRRAAAYLEEESARRLLNEGWTT